jgi:hypothetical protein
MYNRSIQETTTTKDKKMIFSNENELFNAVDNDVNVIGATYTGEVEYGVVLDEEGWGFTVVNGIITGYAQK